MELKEMDVNQKQFIVNINFQNYKKEFECVHEHCIKYINNNHTKDLFNYGFYVLAKEIYFKCFNANLRQEEWNKISRYKLFLQPNKELAMQDFKDAICGYY